MKKKANLFLVNGLALLFLALTACNSPSTSQEVVEQNIEYVKLSPNAFRESMETETTDFLLIDVRTKGEFDAGAIAKAQNFDVTNGDFQKGLNNWDKAKPIYVYCAKGGRSSKAAGILEEKGFQKIIELKGGYSAWQ